MAHFERTRSLSMEHEALKRQVHELSGEHEALHNASHATQRDRKNHRARLREKMAELKAHANWLRNHSQR